MIESERVEVQLVILDKHFLFRYLSVNIGKVITNFLFPKTKPVLKTLFKKFYSILANNLVKKISAAAKKIGIESSKLYYGLES